MTLDDKSAAVPAGGESRISGKVSHRNQAESSENRSFTDVVEKACEKLRSRQIKYSIRRIQKMEEILCVLEKELDEFLLQKDRESR